MYADTGVDACFTMHFARYARVCAAVGIRDFERVPSWTTADKESRQQSFQPEFVVATTNEKGLNLPGSTVIMFQPNPGKTIVITVWVLVLFCFDCFMA